jgi:hypothetical protein
LTGAPNAELDAPAPPPVPGPPNGDLAAGLEGWTVLGREPPPMAAVPEGGVVASLARNTTLVSPPFTVPPGAQYALIRARARAGGADLEVRARPEEGGAELPLAVLSPGRALAAAPVSLAGLGGRTIRMVLDPVEAFGRAVEVAGVGPLGVALPGWSVTRGLPAIAADPAGGRLLRVGEQPLEIVSTPFAPGPGARALIVAVRGAGRVQGLAGGRVVGLRAGPGWRDLRIPLPAGAPAVALTLRAAPGADPLELRDLGLVVRETRLTGLRSSRRPGGRVILGRLVPAGGELVLQALGPGGRRLAATRADRSGRFHLVVRVQGRPPRAVTLVAAGDRTRLAGRWTVTIPSGRQ